jgi:hypothetical protein
MSFLRQWLTSCAFLGCLLSGASLWAGVVGGWSLQAGHATDPLLFKHEGRTLHVLKGLGPVFATPDGEIGPEDYRATVTAVRQGEGGATILACRATADGLAADYTLTFRTLADGAMEMTVAGGTNVAAFRCGKMEGDLPTFKQFYVGQRDMEAYPSNDGAPPLLYWPAGNLFFHGVMDLDASHGAGWAHRLPPKKNFLAITPPVSADSAYGLRTDKTRPALAERYEFRAGTTMWDAYGPVRNPPSEYRQELGEMIYLDLWDGSFALETFLLDWLGKATAGQVKFYTVVEQWGWAGFDATLPDLYRAADHGEPSPGYGSKAELKKLVEIGNTLGRTALRTNYMALNAQTSYSAKEGLVKPALNPDGTAKWHSNFNAVTPLVRRQDGEIRRDFGTTAAFSDQLSSGGNCGAYINADAREPGAGTIAESRRGLRELARLMKEIHQGPVGSESFLADFAFGAAMDTGDFQIFAGDTRHDFTPEEKLRRFQTLVSVHSMGLGYRFFFGPWEADWMGKGMTAYFSSDEKLDSYRACEVLYGNGGYLFFYGGLRLVHALTECYTVGVAQRHYVLQPVDYVKYGKGGLWKTLDRLTADPQIDSLDKLQAWYGRFHVRYANGCHVYVNREAEPLTVVTSGNATIKLPRNGWLVYTEDGALLSYTALVSDPFFPGRETRVDFCEDKPRGIKYVNPRGMAKFMEVDKPTVWLNGKVHLVLDQPNRTVGEAFKAAAKP